MNRQRLLSIVCTLALVSSVAAVVKYCLQSDSKQISRTATDDYSNVHSADYLGPRACVECHPKQHAAWNEHSHGRMNQNATDASVVGDFDDRRVDYGNGHVLFSKLNGQYFMTLFDQDQQIRKYRVTRTVGSRYTQMYIGVQTQGPEPGQHPVYSVEGKLPFGYWMNRDCWTPESYFDSDRGDEPDKPGEMFAALEKVQHTFAWENNCIYCHNTYPYQYRVSFGEGLGFPESDIFVVNGDASIKRWGRVAPEKLVSLGVSCESCHFGCREHVATARATRYVPSSRDLKLTDAALSKSGSDASSPYVVNSICSQCHCAKVARYPNGAATLNSREALDLTSSGCGQRIKCTDCHNPHLPSSAGGLKVDTEIEKTCLQCHESYRDATARLAHTRHSAESKVNCLDCHMPRITQGLDSVVRTHHISSPTNRRMMSLGAPNSCNLCHLDRSIQWTVQELEKGWTTKMYMTNEWKSSYGGNVDQPVGKVWLQHKQPVVRLIAAEAWSRSLQDHQTLPDLLSVLNESTAVNRMFGLFGVERVLGRRLTETEYNPLAPAEKREHQVEALRKHLSE